MTTIIVRRAALLPIPCWLPGVACLLATVLTLAAESAVTGKEASANVEILRDGWGIPHIFATTDAGAFYGLGYATAEDRAFQMTYALRTIQGRLAETIGEVKMTNRNETSVDSDRKMRTFGFHRAAQRTAANLDPETRALLAAYCAGVNDSFAQQRGNLHPLFARLGVKPEPWTPADCLASWWHLGQFFASDGTRELIAGRNPADSGQGRSPRGQGRPSLPGRDPKRPTLPADVKPMPPDDGPAVVKRADVTSDWIERVEGYAREHGLQASGDGPEGPKFSHAWVVGGQRTTTGSSVLVSDPQTPVRNPSLFYEFHLQGKSFNARGIGVPGSPIVLIGFTEQVAWGVTALGADQADLFLLETDLAHADQYRFDGQWRPMTIHRETILVKGGKAIEWVVRETHLGPVATAFCFAQPGEGEVALKRIPVCETDRETIQSAIAMMRAGNVREFHTALSGWRFPSVNLVFGDREGNIGYRGAAAIPVRSREDADSGRKAMPGRTPKHDWQEILPADLLPQVTHPKAGFLYSGNHRPIESWYPLPLGAMTGAGGDTLRSWRLRERLEAKTKFSPEEVRDIHYDTVNPARREIVRIGLHLRDGLKRELSEDALQALAHLEPWYRAGASSSLTSKGAELAIELNTFFRFMNTDLALVYGGGESGLAYFLKTAAARLERDAQADFSPIEQAYLDQVLAGAWQSAREKHGGDPSAWNERAQLAVRQRRLGYFESLDGFPTLDAAQDLKYPALAITDGGTIASQASQSYTQWVPMHDPDQAQSVLPIGQSEWPNKPSRTSTMSLWSEGKLHPAPLSRAKVEPLVVSRKTLPAADRVRPTAEPSTAEPPASSIRLPLTPPPGRVVHGMGQWIDYNTKLLAALPAAVRPAAQLLFIDIGDTPRGWQPQRLAAMLQGLGRDGLVPVIDIGLRGNQPTKVELAQRADKLFGIDQEVASSTRFDSRLDDLAKAVREFGQPVMVRIGGEFNGAWNGYHPYAYPQAFRKIVRMFREAGVANAAFVWCYEPSASGDFDEQNAQGQWKWFPGDDVVDWFSIDWFNTSDFTGPLVGGRQGRQPTAHGRSRKFLDLAVAHRKPVIVAESAPCGYDLADPQQAEAAWREWFEPYFQLIAERPEIKWFHLISYDWTRSRAFTENGWKNNDFTAAQALLDRLVEELKKPRYLHAAERKTLAGDPALALARAAPSNAIPAATAPRRSQGNESPKAAVEPGRPTPPATAQSGTDKATELAKWDDAAKHRPQTGPGGTAWDAQYRSFIQTDENATSKGYPTHAEAAKQIKADATKSAELLQQHQGWVLHLKHFSQAYRPDSATADLKQLYEDLVTMRFGGEVRMETLPFAGDARLTIHRDVIYGKSAPEAQRLDAYLVKAERTTPVLIEFHGGGWRRGAKSQFIYSAGLMESILAAGVSVISVDYRLTPKHPLPAQIEDAARAVQFVRSKAKEWNLDPERIGAMGCSAGAHLAAWVALHDDLARPDGSDPVERHSTRLHAFVDLSGPMDLTRVRPTELAQAGLRGADFAAAFTDAFACTAEAFEQDPDIRRRVREASPLLLVTRDDPPALIVHMAGQDLTPENHPPVPEIINDPHSAWHGVLLADAMHKAGIGVVCRIGPQVGKNPEADNAAILAFLRQQLLSDK